MTLDAEQRRITAAELRANLARAAVTEEHARAGSGLDEDRWVEALRVSSRSRLADVWAVRDRLVALVHAAGREPVPFTVLTEDARHAAHAWFDVR
jgi:hypothetical protein